MTRTTAALGLWFLCVAAVHASSPPLLMLPLDAPLTAGKASLAPVPAQALRHQYAVLNEDLFSPYMLGAEELLFDTLEVRLFDETPRRVRIQSREFRSASSYTIVGAPERIPHAYAIISYEGGVVHAVFHEPFASPVEIQTADGGLVHVFERDPASLAPCGGGRVWTSDEEAPPVRTMMSDVSPMSSGNVTVDVAVVYTPQARIGAGSTHAIHSAIETAVAQANLALSNSLTDVELRLVYRGEVDYMEPNDMNLDLDRLTDPNDGFLTEVHCIRNHYGADLVQLITETGQYGGLAWIMCSPGSHFASSGFSITRRDGLTSYTLAHEFGHNFGCDHDPDNLSSCKAHDYSQGHRYFHNSEEWRTVMAYWPGNLIGRYSNPDVSFGAPTGIPNERDNARTLRETAPIVAGFRATATPQAPPMPTNVEALSVHTNAVRITWDGCGATEYVVRRDGVPVGATSARRFTDTGLAVGVTYCWTVAASNEYGLSSYSSSSCAATPGSPPFVLDGEADFGSYLQSDPGMTIYAAVRGSNLYVSTWSTGIYPGNTSKNDHFIFVSDALLASASASAPWGKSGNVAVATTKPYLASESNNDYISWFNAPGSATAYKSLFSQMKMEGVINLVQTFGSLPPIVYVAVAAYNTQDSGGLVAQAPAMVSDNGHIDPDEFLALYTLAIKDDSGDGVYDRLDPNMDFVTHEIESDPGGVTVVWASVPGQGYRVDFADSPLDEWQLGANVTAGSGQLFLSWTDASTAATTSRVYRVLLE